MASYFITVRYPLTFIAGIFAYAAAGFARAALEPYLIFPFPPPNFSGPAYVWWAYDVIGFISVYYWLIIYCAVFCVLCLAVQTITASKLSARRLLMAAATITVLVTITVCIGTWLEAVLDPQYTNPFARNVVDAIIFALIGGWFVLGNFMVWRR